MNPWLWFVGITLIFVGFLLIILSTLLQKTEIKTGGMILIGPIPLVFGTDKETVVFVSLLAIIIMILALLLLRAL